MRAEIAASPEPVQKLARRDAVFFVQRFHAPDQGTRVLTDNGKGFTVRQFGSADRQPTGKHAFEQLCEAMSIA